MSKCALSDGIRAVAHHYSMGAMDYASWLFASAALECADLNTDEFWFTDEELDLCRAYVAQTKEVSDEAW